MIDEAGAKMLIAAARASADELDRLGASRAFGWQLRMIAGRLEAGMQGRFVEIAQLVDDARYDISGVENQP